MPVIDAPFVAELRPFEDLKLATASQKADVAAPSANPPKNTFTAMVSSVHFEELTDSEAQDKAGADSGDQKTKKKESAKDVDVRITLVANMCGESDSDAAAALRCVTLASHIFRAPAKPNAAQGTSTTLETNLVILKSPLLFSSEGSIRSLSVLAHAVSPSAEACSDAKQKGPRAYRGTRRFMVRLLGVQQTTLTAEQVLLLASSRK